MRRKQGKDRARLPERVQGAQRLKRTEAASPGSASTRRGAGAKDKSQLISEILQIIRRQHEGVETSPESFDSREHFR